jgi:hypothetical protein
VEEMLFSRCENEICSAVYTLEDAILKLRHRPPCPVINLNCGRIRRRGFDPATALLNLPA